MTIATKNITRAMRRINNIHFVGIGGAGMGGIAEVLLSQGYHVTGSDINENAVVKRLKTLGATIFLNHNESNIETADVVVQSSAIAQDNIEITVAKARRIPVIPRAEMLAELMRFQHGIAVAGTHGKTTTTSLIASLLTDGGLDPTFVIGGLLKSAGCNARRGESCYFVAEADESDASFLYLQPLTSVVTNIDADHMDTYDGDFSKLKQTFIDFIHHLPFYGLAILCLDDPIIRELLPQISRPTLTYGFHQDADVRATDYHQQGVNACFQVTLAASGQTFPVTLNLPGRHNVANALASISVALDAGVEVTAIQQSLANFQGIGRRFQVAGPFACGAGDVLVVDDYGHHPNEVGATIDAVREAWPERRLVMAFQPHRYTRTRDCFDKFVKVLATVDHLILLDIYPAGEAPIKGAEAYTLWQGIKQIAQGESSFIPRGQAFAPILRDTLQAGDVLVLQGAGDIGMMAQEIMQQQLNWQALNNI